MANASKQTSSGGKASTGSSAPEDTGKQANAKQANVKQTSEYQDVIDRAEQTDTPDSVKYSYAVSLAQDELGDNADPDDLRETIDTYFSQLNPTQTGEQFRGEDNLFSQVGRGARGAIDTLVGAGGDFLDGAWDTVMGGIGDAFGDEAGDMLRDLFDDEDAEIAADVLLDVGLAAIPFVGPALSLGKNLAQNSENIYEAVSGRDDVTGRELTAGERIGSGGLAALGLLPSVAGLGRTANVAKTLSAASKGDEAAKALAKNMTPRAAIDNITSTMKSIPATAKGTASGVGEALSSIGKQGSVLGNIRQVPKALKSARSTVANDVGAVASGLNPLAGFQANDVYRYMAGSKPLKQGRIARTASEGIRDAASRGGAGAVAKNLGAKGLGALGDMGMNLATNSAGIYGANVLSALRNGASIEDAIAPASYFESIGQQSTGIPIAFMFSHLPGSGMRGRVGATGNPVNTAARAVNPITNPSLAVRTGAYANNANRGTGPTSDTTTDMMRRYLLGGDEDGSGEQGE